MTFLRTRDHVVVASITGSDLPPEVTEYFMIAARGKRAGFQLKYHAAKASSSRYTGVVLRKSLEDPKVLVVVYQGGAQLLLFSATSATHGTTYVGVDNTGLHLQPPVPPALDDPTLSVLYPLAPSAPDPTTQLDFQQALDGDISSADVVYEHGPRSITDDDGTTCTLKTFTALYENSNALSALYISIDAANYATVKSDTALAPASRVIGIYPCTHDDGKRRCVFVQALNGTDWLTDEHTFGEPTIALAEVPGACIPVFPLVPYAGTLLADRYLVVVNTTTLTDGYEGIAYDTTTGTFCAPFAATSPATGTGVNGDTYAVSTPNSGGIPPVPSAHCVRAGNPVLSLITAPRAGVSGFHDPVLVNELHDGTGTHFQLVPTDTLAFRVVPFVPDDGARAIFVEMSPPEANLNTLKVSVYSGTGDSKFLVEHNNSLVTPSAPGGYIRDSRFISSFAAKVRSGEHVGIFMGTGFIGFARFITLMWIDDAGTAIELADAGGVEAIAYNLLSLGAIAYNAAAGDDEMVMSWNLLVLHASKVTQIIKILGSVSVGVVRSVQTPRGNFLLVSGHWVPAGDAPGDGNPRTLSLIEPNGTRHILATAPDDHAIGGLFGFNYNHANDILYVASGYNLIASPFTRATRAQTTLNAIAISKTGVPAITTTVGLGAFADDAAWGITVPLPDDFLWGSGFSFQSR